MRLQIRICMTYHVVLKTVKLTTLNGSYPPGNEWIAGHAPIATGGEALLT